ncbi:FERM N-terminal domain [Popillia japonica]|uniref:FERM N-terminal domain n=1 Tax=Popillia japonica TaxID=7064 RepID=A0AAW1JDF0_POPJA
MDSKNLLDVVDAIRIRYPNINPYAQNPKDSAQSIPVEVSDPESETSSDTYHPNLPHPVGSPLKFLILNLKHHLILTIRTYPIRSTTTPSNVSPTQIVDS